MKSYVIYLERKNKGEMYRYFITGLQAANFRKALKAAETKIEELKLQTKFDYEIKKIEKI